MAYGQARNQAKRLDKNEKAGSSIKPGIYLGVVKKNTDEGQRAGRIWVWLPEFQGDENNENSWIPVSYASPFYGISPHPVPNPNAEQQEKLPPTTSYGFWAIPPDLGVQVLCSFIEGRQTLGYWFAVVPTLSHAMVPAMGAPDGKTPVMDLNPYTPEHDNNKDLFPLERQPYEPLIQQFTTQGIQEDPVRGPITSSSMRESPSRVFGISSQATPDAPGHSFVMDDGDAEGKNKLIRIRTSGGNQITMNDDSGMIYMINASGTGWLEISPSGQIDVYGEAGINLASKGDINLHAENNVNIHANNCIKIVATNGTKVQGGSELQLHGAKTMIEGVDSLHVHSCTEMMFTSYGDIHMKAFNYFCLKGKCFYWNSCTAKEAEQVPPEKPEEVSGYQTTVARAPAHEPYKEHDNGQSQGGGGQPGSDAASAGLGEDGGGAAPDGSASGTGPGGMFGGGSPAMDTPATSLGTNKFSLGFKTGLAGNKVSNSTTPGTSATAPKASNTPAVTNAPARGVTPIYVQKDRVIDQNSTYIQTSTIKYTPDSKNGTITNTIVERNKQTGDIISTKTTSEAATKEYADSVQKNYTDPSKQTAGAPTTSTDKGQDPMNNDDGTRKGSSPAQEASQALDQSAGQTPSSDLPAAPGGGNTGCFATGDNCDRPADETGGGYDGDPNANAAQTNYAANDPEGKAAAEAYLGRPMSDSEYNALVAATAAEAGTNQTEQAWVSGTILNRVRARGPGATVQSVLGERGQFEAVTGPGGNANFRRGPNPTRAASINGSMTGILKNVPKNNYYFDAANPAAYRYGSMPTNRNGVAPTRIGASRFYPGASW